MARKVVINLTRNLFGKDITNYCTYKGSCKVNCKSFRKVKGKDYGYIVCDYKSNCSCKVAYKVKEAMKYLDTT